MLPLRLTGVPTLPPSIWKCTVPVSPLPPAGVTVAVKVIGCPEVGVLLLEVTAVAMPALFTVRFIVALPLV